MVLPSLVKKLVAFFLASALLFSVSTSVIANHQSVPVPHAPEGNPSAPAYYKIVPIPPPGGSQEVVPIPPPSNQDPQIQQVGIFGDIFGTIGDIFGGVTDCITDPLGCAASTLSALIKTGVYIVEHAFLIQIAGDVAGEIVEVFAYDDPNKALARLQEMMDDPASAGSFGALGVADGLTTTLLALPVPVSTSRYIAHINPFPTAEAQTGSQALRNSNAVIFEVWQRVRDASYALAVAVLVIIGFMIMLRWKLGPRTTVTIQNSLPRIVIALLLITFSFAISGLMIDLMRVFANILDGLVPLGAAQLVNMFIAASAAIYVLLISSLLGGWGIVLAIIGLLLLLVLAIAIMVVFFILIYKLVMRYVIFLLLTMFAPIFFLVGAIPGAEGIIYMWFKRSFAALLAIPAVGLILKLAFAIGFSGGGVVDPGVSKTIIDAANPLPIIPNLLGGEVGGALLWIAAAPVIGLGLFFFSTKVPDMVDELLGARGFGGGGRGGGGFGPGAIIGAPIGGLRTVGNVSRGLSGVRSMATSYAAPYAGMANAPFSARLARGALRVPGVGTPEARVMAGTAPTHEKVRVHEMETEVEKRRVVARDAATPRVEDFKKQMETGAEGLKTTREESEKGTGTKNY